MTTQVNYTVAKLVNGEWISVVNPGISAIDVRLSCGIGILHGMESLGDKPLVYSDLFGDTLTITKYSDHIRFQINYRINQSMDARLDISSYTRFIRAAYSLHLNNHDKSWISSADTGTTLCVKI